jgi:hypothetical protein
MSCLVNARAVEQSYWGFRPWLLCQLQKVVNPKSEARNPKQSPMIQIQMTKTVGRWVCVLKIGALVF